MEQDPMSRMARRPWVALPAVTAVELPAVALRRRLRWACAWVLLLACASSRATTLDVAVLLEGQWHAEVGAAYCRLTRTMPGVGEAGFERRAARAERFTYVLQARVPDGDVQASVQAPPWHPTFPADAHLATLPRPTDGRTLALSAAAAQDLRRALGKGLAGVFSADASPSRGWPVPASGFAAAHARYERCLSRLPPALPAGPRPAAVAVARAAAPRAKLRARVRFDAQETRLGAADRRALSALLAKSGTGAQRVLVSGFSDDDGDFADNVALSRRRAQAVADFLRAAGVPPSRIAVRYFGDQYPVADSLTDAGRAQNRRATVEILN
jgi:outer membrane protein OmpA-like peptidoglycan-associated protein